VRITRALTGCFALFGLFVFLLLVAVGVLAWFAVRSLVPGAPQLPERILLVADLRGSLPARGLPDPRELFGESRPDLTATLEALERAADDPRVVGLLARVDATSHGLAAAGELRAAVRRIAEAGKRTVAHAEDLGGLAPGNEGYLLASGFDTVAVGPLASLGITGLAVEMPYLGGLLERLGVRAEIVQREEYKTAFENFVAREPSPQQLEQLNALLDDVHGRFVETLAEARAMTPSRVQELVDGAPWSAEEARDLGLVDRIANWPELRGELADELDAEAVPLSRYVAALRAERPEGAVTVALIPISGTLRRGDGPPFEGAFAEPIVKALDAAAQDEEVRAVILRIDSPGGDALAAEEVARAVARVRDAGKPVVASLVNAGASGAYWIAAAADRIVTGADTLTGSIGVIAAKPVLADLAAQLDVRTVRLERGRNAGMWSVLTAFDPAERRRAEALVDTLYGHFLDHVAKGRSMDPARVRQLAKGRVWTGAQAAERGLADVLGGLWEAKAVVRGLLRLAPDAPLRLMVLPKADLAAWIAALRRSLPLVPFSLDPPGPGLALAPLPEIR